MDTKLNEIKRTKNGITQFSLKRRDEVILNRLRIGHTRFTYAHLRMQRHLRSQTKIQYTWAPLYEALGPDEESIKNKLLFMKNIKLYN